MLGRSNIEDFVKRGDFLEQRLVQCFSIGIMLLHLINFCEASYY